MRVHSLSDTLLDEKVGGRERERDRERERERYSER